jgi:hypothetical protein
VAVLPPCADVWSLEPVFRYTADNVLAPLGIEPRFLISPVPGLVAVPNEPEFRSHNKDWLSQ